MLNRPLINSNLLENSPEPRNALEIRVARFFSDQKSQFGYILEDRGIENVVLYCHGHLEYFTAIG
jgi:hypothetical protein